MVCVCDVHKPRSAVVPRCALDLLAGQACALAHSFATAKSHHHHIARAMKGAAGGEGSTTVPAHAHVNSCTATVCVTHTYSNTNMHTHTHTHVHACNELVTCRSELRSTRTSLPRSQPKPQPHQHAHTRTHLHRVGHVQVRVAQHADQLACRGAPDVDAAIVAATDHVLAALPHPRHLWGQGMLQLCPRRKHASSELACF